MIPLTEAARRLGRVGLSYFATWDRVVSGRLRGVQLENGRWMVNEADVEELARRREAAATASR